MIALVCMRYTQQIHSVNSIVLVEQLNPLLIFKFHAQQSPNACQLPTPKAVALKFTSSMRQTYALAWMQTYNYQFHILFHYYLML